MDQSILQYLHSSSDEEKRRASQVLEAVEGLSVYEAERILLFCAENIKHAGTVNSASWKQ